MAKKKSKKSPLTSVGVLTAMAAALLAVVAICMMFVPAATISELKLEFTGLQMTFGYKEGEAVIFAFSFLNFLPYLLALAGIAFSVLTALGKLGKIAPIIATVCYLAAGVLFFLVITCSVLGEGFDTILSLGSLLLGKGSGKELLSLGAGAIVAGVLSILAALCSAVAVIKK